MTGNIFYKTRYNEHKLQEHFGGACSMQAGFQNNIRDLYIQRHIFFHYPKWLGSKKKTNIDNGRIYGRGNLKSQSGFHRFLDAQNNNVIWNYSLIIVPNIGAACWWHGPQRNSLQTFAICSLQRRGTVRLVWTHSLHFWCSRSGIKHTGLFFFFLKKNSVPGTMLWHLSFHIE